MNQRNFQKELDAVIEKNRKAGERPRLLIHACCAPCSSYVMEYLREYFDITMFFSNPNMNSAEEYERRAAELRRLAPCLGVDAVVIDDYRPQEFAAIAAGHEKDPERGPRCLLCYELRLRNTAGYMKRKNESGAGYAFFTTTLSISPLKDAGVLNRIGEQIAGEYGLVWLPSDFKKRDGYKRSIELSRQYELYRQDYCGCIYSMQSSGKKELL